MNDKHIIKNIGISMLMKPISMFLVFIYTPLALLFLGDEKYGVWAIILNVISWINYFDIGIGNGLRNKLTEAVTENNELNAKKYVSTAYIGTIIISVIFGSIISIVWCAFDLSSVFRLNTPDENSEPIMLVSIVFVCINFVFSLNKTITYAIQKPALISVISVVGSILQIAIVFVLSCLTRENLMAVAIMYGMVTLFENCLLGLIVKRKKDYLKFSMSMIDFSCMKSLLTLGSGFFIIQISSLILNTTDNLLISYLYGSTQVTPYSIVYKIFSMFVQVHGIIIMPMWSAYTEANTKKDIVWIRNTIKKINVISGVLTVGAIITIFIFKPVVSIWLGKNLEYSYGLIVVTAVYVIMQMFANNYSSFLCGIGNIKISAVISLISAATNIPLSIFFAYMLDMKLTGIMLGSLIVMSISFFVLPAVSHKWIKAKETEWTIQEKSYE